MAFVTVYRGQKEWSEDMEISAPSLRRALGANDPELWTDMLLANIDALIRKSEAGDEAARQQLEQEFLHAQQAAYHNPYVSCSYQWGSHRPSPWPPIHPDTSSLSRATQGRESIARDDRCLVANAYNTSATISDGSYAARPRPSAR
jgi:hypothetical protein